MRISSKTKLGFNLYNIKLTEKLSYHLNEMDFPIAISQSDEFSKTNITLLAFNDAQKINQRLLITKRFTAQILISNAHVY